LRSSGFAELAERNLKEETLYDDLVVLEGELFIEFLDVISVIVQFFEEQTDRYSLIGSRKAAMEVIVAYEVMRDEWVVEPVNKLSS
jgi:hypothetical protein